MKKKELEDIIKRFIGNRNLSDMTDGEFAISVLKEASHYMNMKEIEQIQEIAIQRHIELTESLNYSIKPRVGFYLHHKCWIEFLNNRSDLDQDKIGNLNLNELSKPLEEWQIDYGIFVKIQDKNGSGVIIKFESERDFLTACYNFMYENLKAISRGESNELKKIGVFELKEVNSMLDIVSRVSDKKATINFDFPYLEQSTIYEMSRKLARFLEYINDCLSGKPIYKIGICPYHRKNKPECGKVFVAKQWNSDACETHAKLWATLRIRRQRAKEMNDKIKKLSSRIDKILKKKKNQ